MEIGTQGAALRAARVGRGWSQSRAAAELAALGVARGAPTASPASLKTQLSRWENGHVMPEPVYRELLAELLERPELADAPGPGPATDGAGRLRAAVMAAAAVDDEALALLRRQLEASRLLDLRLGAAATAATVGAQVEQLATLLAHTVDGARRRAVARLLAEAALLAGWQALDQDLPDVAFAHHDRAGAAARDAAAPDLLGQAMAGRSTVLLAVGLPGPAAAVLDTAVLDTALVDTALVGTALVDTAVRNAPGPGAARPGAGPAPGGPGADIDAGHSPGAGPSPGDSGRHGPGAAWIALARGALRAAADDADGSRAAFDHAAEAALVDVVAPGIAIDLDLVRRRRYAALAAHGDDEALDGLRAATAGTSAAAMPVREQAGLLADLSLALRARGATADAAVSAREARALAARIGSYRVRRLLDDRSGQPDAP